MSDVCCRRRLLQLAVVKEARGNGHLRGFLHPENDESHQVNEVLSDPTSFLNVAESSTSFLQEMSGDGSTELRLFQQRFEGTGSSLAATTGGAGTDAACAQLKTILFGDDENLLNGTTYGTLTSELDTASITPDTYDDTFATLQSEANEICVKIVECFGSAFGDITGGDATCKKGNLDSATRFLLYLKTNTNGVPPTDMSPYQRPFPNTLDAPASAAILSALAAVPDDLVAVHDAVDAIANATDGDAGIIEAKLRIIDAKIQGLTNDSGHTIHASAAYFKTTAETANVVSAFIPVRARAARLVTDLGTTSDILSASAGALRALLPARPDAGGGGVILENERVVLAQFSEAGNEEKQAAVVDALEALRVQIEAASNDDPTLRANSEVERQLVAINDQFQSLDTKLQIAGGEEVTARAAYFPSAVDDTSAVTCTDLESERAALSAKITDAHQASADSADDNGVKLVSTIGSAVIATSAEALDVNAALTLVKDSKNLYIPLTTSLLADSVMTTDLLEKDAAQLFATFDATMSGKTPADTLTAASVPQSQFEPIFQIQEVCRVQAAAASLNISNMDAETSVSTAETTFVFTPKEDFDAITAKLLTGTELNTLFTSQQTPTEVITYEYTLTDSAGTPVGTVRGDALGHIKRADLLGLVTGRFASLTPLVKAQKASTQVVLPASRVPANYMGVMTVEDAQKTEEFAKGVVIHGANLEITLDSEEGWTVTVGTKTAIVNVEEAQRGSGALGALADSALTAAGVTGADRVRFNFPANTFELIPAGTTVQDIVDDGSGAINGEHNTKIRKMLTETLPDDGTCDIARAAFTSQVEAGIPTASAS